MPSSNLQSLQIGQLCAARYSGTGDWHRCYIVDVHQNHVKVSFDLLREITFMT